MASGQIRMTTDTMRERAGEYRTEADNVAYDQLLCNVNFQVYAVQNLDRNGLPY